MRIAMFTNVDQPPCGGVTRSIELLESACITLGHPVRVFAPRGTLQHRHNDMDLVCLPAMHMPQTPFSTPLPAPSLIDEAISQFQPDIIHTHNPFFLGATAMRVAAKFHLPIVYTHHTRYEEYLHHFDAHGTYVQRVIREFVEGYASLCDAVIAPSESIAYHLRSLINNDHLTVIPTGVHAQKFYRSSQESARQRFAIPFDVPVVGTVCRLEPEKNLLFLCDAVRLFLEKTARSQFLCVGDGSQRMMLQEYFAQWGLSHRVHFPGTLQDDALRDAYNAMDVFAFSSTTETQGVVLAEAMTCGIPVVALDAPGARDIVDDRVNGRLLPHEDVKEFADALMWVAESSGSAWLSLRECAARTARRYDHLACAKAVCDLYTDCIYHAGSYDRTTVMKRWETEYLLWQNIWKACISAKTSRSR